MFMYKLVIYIGIYDKNFLIYSNLITQKYLSFFFLIFLNSLTNLKIILKSKIYLLIKYCEICILFFISIWSNIIKIKMLNVYKLEYLLLFLNTAKDLYFYLFRFIIIF